MENEPILKVSGISHNYFVESEKIIHVLDNISFTAIKGEFLSIVGPSGGGKSTILRIIAGLIKPVRGNVTFSGKKISMVFQNYGIFPWLTVQKNIEFGLLMSGMAENERRRIVAEKINEVGLVDVGHKYPKELSGGMRQRVGIARALSVSPDLILMDEPFSNLDSFTAEKLRQDLLRIWTNSKMTVIMVTHLVEEAIELSDRILIFGPRPAKIKDEIKLSLSRPREKRSPEFFQITDKIKSEILAN